MDFMNIFSEWMTAYPQSFYSTMCGAALVLYAMTIGKLTKEGGVKSWMSLPAIAFLIGFHQQFWSSNSIVPGTAWIYGIGCFVTFVFMLGVGICTTKSFHACNGELCINQDSIGYRMLRLLPLKLEGRSLCSISWLGALLILILPVLMAVLYLISFIVACVICLFTGQNVFKYASEICEFTSWPDTEMQFIGRLPKGPGLYLLAGALIFLLVTMASMVATVLLWLFAALVCFLLIWLISYAFIVMAEIGSADSRTEESNESSDVAYARRQMLKKNEGPLQAFTVYQYFWQVFKHKFCPKIKYVDSSEFEEERAQYDYSI